MTRPKSDLHDRTGALPAGTGALPTGTGALPAGTGALPASEGAAAPASDPDALILALASQQHGVVAQWQLQRAGVPRHRIAYQLRKRWLESIYRGIYQVGPIAPPRHREMAAVLACGVGAVLSHQSAGGLWDLIPLPPATAPVTVSTTRDLRGRGSGVRLYSVASLREDEVTHLDALPLTTPTRTLLDLAGTLSTRELEQALARADRQRLLDLIQIEALLARHPRRRGNARLRALLAAPNAPALTRSEAEERFLALVRKAGLRHPETNVAIRGFEVDALWRAERLVVEIDGFAFHSAPAAFERDRQRDGVLTAAGLRVLRITWSQLTREPEVVLVRLAQALTARGAPP